MKFKDRFNPNSTGKTVVFLSFILTISFLLFKFNCSGQLGKKYDVRITFCDSRKPVIVTTRALFRPSNYDIDTYKQGVSSYTPNFIGRETYINVCDISVVKEY